MWKRARKSNTATWDDDRLDAALELAFAKDPQLSEPDNAYKAQDLGMQDAIDTVPEVRIASDLSGVAFAGYEMLGEIGRGAMGVVYKARQLGLNRVVALKMILEGGHAGPKELARFQAEAEAVARLEHPNIVQIHEFGQQHGLPYFSLEFCAGGSLAEKLNGSPELPRSAAKLMQLLALAIHAAHQKNVVHRDLKPANVLLGEDGTPKISDFGLAKTVGDGQATASGTVLGTPSYMAPEQARGKNQAIGPAVDIYALGAILYELITGRPPFKAATSLDTILQVLHHEPVPPSQLCRAVPRDLETICLKCLRKEPRSRYDTAQALADDLGRYVAGEAILARPVSALERGLRWARRNPALATLIALSTLLVVTIAIGSSVAAVLLRIERANVVAEQERRRETVVDALLIVNPAGVPVLLREMNDNRLAYVPLVLKRSNDSLTADQQLRLAMALTSLGEPRTDSLLRAVPTAPAGECPNLVTAFASLPDGVKLVRQAFDNAQDDERFRFAVLLLEMGDASAARMLLAFDVKPHARASFANQFPGWHGDLAALPKVLRREQDSALRSGLCASLGRLDPGMLSPPVTAALVDELRALYRDAEDAATHATAGWALRKWQQTLPALDASDRPGTKQWHVTRHGLTMIRAEPHAAKPYPWSLWVSDREVSTGLFRQFINDEQWPATLRIAGWKGVDPSVSPTDDCPVHHVNLHDIMLFCNWLSHRDGRMPCYEPMPDKQGIWKCNFGNNGYRLPTNAEWEYAGRAGTTTKYYFGDDIRLLPDYANILLPYSEPSGNRIPNDWGLFSVLANCWEMCFDGASGKGEFPETAPLTMRGGTYGTGTYVVGFDFRGQMPPGDRSASHGFRLVYREGASGPVGRAEVDIETLGRLIQFDPVNPSYRKQLATLIRELDPLSAAADDVISHLSSDPRDMAMQLAAAHVYIKRNRWDKACDHMRRVAELDANNHLIALQLATLLLTTRDLQGYRQHREQLLDRWSETQEMQAAERIAKACCLFEPTDDQAAAALVMAVRASRQTEHLPAESVSRSWCLLAEALAQYRCGHYDAAVNQSRAVCNHKEMRADARVPAHLIRAMALCKLDRVQEACMALAEAKAIDLPEEGTPAFYTHWADHLMCILFFRETEALLAAK